MRGKGPDRPLGWPRFLDPRYLTSVGEASSGAREKAARGAKGPAYPTVGALPSCFACFRDPRTLMRPGALGAVFTGHNC